MNRRQALMLHNATIIMLRYAGYLPPETEEELLSQESLINKHKTKHIDAKKIIKESEETK